ncbi:MAG: hypothetical protein RLZZ385_896 [Pseudomonadota bacterium]
MNNSPSRARQAGLAAGTVVLLLVTAAIYWPGLSGPFIFDDYANLQNLGLDGGVTDWESFRRFVFGNMSGPTGRPVAMLTFLLDGQDWPPLVSAFKYTNVMIHLLCGLMVFWLFYLVSKVLGVAETTAACLGLLTAAIWLLHPLNATTTLYVIQRMTQLMTLFAVAGLVCYVKGRSLTTPQESYRGVGLLCCALFPLGLLSVLSKENGALMLLLIVALESTVFAHHPRPRLFRLWYRLGVLVPLGLLALAFITMIVSGLDSYQFRDFTPIQRLLTEARILVIYLSKIVFPNAIGVGLYHDEIAISTSLFEPWTTLPAVVFLLALIISAFALLRRQPIFSLAVFWFFGMHVMESTILPLELYFEHRNYISMIGPLFAVVWYGRQALLHSRYPVVRKALLGVTAGLLLIVMWLTLQIASLWGNANQLYAYWAFEKPNSFRSQWVYADYLLATGDPAAAMERLEMARRNRPKEVATMIHQWNLACETGLEAPQGLAEIADRPDLLYTINNVNPLIKTLLENYYLGACDYPEPAILQRLLERIAAMPQEANRLANYYVIYSDFYVFQANLDQALIQLSKGFALRRDPVIPIRQAILSASAGNFSDALVFLERARQADAERRPLMPSSAAEIERLTADFSRRVPGAALN